MQWVAGTQHGNVERVLEKDDQQLPEARQRELIDKFLHDTRAQNKQVAEADHDDKQIDDLLKLLPVAFIWTETGATATTTSLHFDPAPSFHPPTREARVFSSMTGDLVVDNQQHRICKIKGHLFHDVTFGGGLLGRLKERSSFALEQQQVGPSDWELTQIHVHLEGNALLFKSVSLQQDDKRSRFQPEPANVDLEQAAKAVMSEPQLLACDSQTQVAWRKSLPRASTASLSFFHGRAARKPADGELRRSRPPCCRGGRSHQTFVQHFCCLSKG